MLDCLSIKSSASSSTSPPVPNRSQENTPNVSREYKIALQANSYTEIRSKIQAPTQQGEAQFLNPNRDHVEEALNNAQTTTRTISLTRLISTYFDHTETASDLCLHLFQCVTNTRATYAPLLDFLDTVDSANLTQHDCDRAFHLFVNFDSEENPVSDSHTFTNIRTSLSDLKTQLNSRIEKSLSRVRLFRCITVGSALCLIVTAVVVIAAAVALTIHAFVAIAAPFCCACVCVPTEKKELARLAQLDAAAKCAYVLSSDLGTIDRLAARLRSAVEGDKALVRLGLERGNEKHTVREVLKQLCKNRESLLHQLEDLEEHICLCFYTINKARSLLLREICNHQTF